MKKVSKPLTTKNLITTFDKLKEVEEATDSYIVYYQHSYLASAWDLSKRRHYCLKFGDWCWKNALDHPLDLISYLLTSR